MSSTVLIAGLGRSGTTWLGKIFDSHPRVLYRNEPDRESSIPRIPSFACSTESDVYYDVIHKYVSTMPFLSAANTAASLPVFRKHYETAFEYIVRCGATIGCKVAAEAFPRLRIPTFLTSARAGSLRLVWKSISCMGILGLLKACLPELQIIVLVRHPCGMICSRIRGEQKGDFRAIRRGSNKAEQIRAALESLRVPGLKVSADDLDDLSPAEWQALRWVVDNYKAMQETRDAEDCTVIRYEDLCERLEVSVQRLFELVGLEIHPQTSRFLKKSTAGHRNGYYSLKKDPERASNAWRDRLPLSQQEQIALVVRDTPPGRLYFAR